MLLTIVLPLRLYGRGVRVGIGAHLAAAIRAAVSSLPQRSWAPGPPSRPPSEAFVGRTAEQGAALGQRQAAPHPVRLPDGEGVTAAVLEHGQRPQICLARVSRSARAGPRSPSGWKNSALSRSRQAARSCTPRFRQPVPEAFVRPPYVPPRACIGFRPKRDRRGPERREHVFTSGTMRETDVQGLLSGRWSGAVGAVRLASAHRTHGESIGARPRSAGLAHQGSTRRGHGRRARSSTKTESSSFTL